MIGGAQQGARFVNDIVINIRLFCSASPKAARPPNQYLAGASGVCFPLVRFRHIITEPMPLNEWLNVDLLKLASRHCTGSLIVILFFSGVAWVARNTMHEGYVLAYVELVDSIVIIACITWLGLIMVWELGSILWGVVTGGNRGQSVLVA